MSVIEAEPVAPPITVAEPNEAQRILLEARSLIADESKWCKGSLYKNGRVCAVGAVAMTLGYDLDRDREHDEDDMSPYEMVADSAAAPFLIAAAQEVIDDGQPVLSDIHNVNDDTDHRTVMQMFDRAIALAGADRA